MQKPQFKENISLKEYTTYGIGGPAKRLIEVSTIDELREAFLSLGDDRFIVIGKGSNLLFDDRGFNGTVIVNKIQFIEWGETSVHVGGGYSFALLGSQTARKGLMGLEFAACIPGSVGGAVYMNAGANKMETKDVLVSVSFLHPDGQLEEFQRKDLSFDYRYSPFQEMDGAIVSARFALTPQEAVKEKQREIIEYRKKTQPLTQKSCGCVFRNPEGDAAGRIIDECGLKGLNLGGATVSPVHANFIVNDGGATAENIMDLIRYIQIKAFHRLGKKLEAEVIYIPYDDEEV